MMDEIMDEYQSEGSYGDLSGQGNKHKQASPKSKEANKRKTLEEINLEECVGSPIVWANTRTDLSETIPWFTCPQGFFSGKTNDTRKYYDPLREFAPCTGVLLDKITPSEIPYVDEEILIFRVNTGFKLIGTRAQVRIKNWEDKRQMTLSKDLRLDKIPYKWLDESIKRQIPVGAIITPRYNSVLGRTLPHNYNIMDYFAITDMWPEKVDGHVTMKLRLQKINLSKKSWWASKNSADPPDLSTRDFSLQPKFSKCLSCKGQFKQIYIDGWMCLNRLCNDFWMINGVDMSGKFTGYHPDFLNYRDNYNVNEWLERAMWPFLPELPAIVNDDTNTYKLGQLHRQGVICPQCRRCIPRNYWKGWVCDTEYSYRSDHQKGCSWSLTIPVQVTHASEVDPSLSVWRNNNALLDLFIHDRVHNEVFDMYMDPIEPTEDLTSVLPWRRLIYKLGDVGSITQFIPNDDINDSQYGANHLFESLQTLDIGLRRERVHSMYRTDESGLLTSHCMKNIGTPYRFVDRQGSLAFREAPDDILRIFSRLVWASDKIHDERQISRQIHNEMLCIGYLHDDKLDWHCDGKDLGPTVASLSLGAMTTMYFRMKKRYFFGFGDYIYATANRVQLNDPVLEGCYLYEERKSLKEQYESEAISREQYKQELEKLLLQGPKAPFKNRNMPTSPPIIAMDLYHGHIVVQHGMFLQRYYEHRVVPATGGIRFAMTARRVISSNPSPEDLEYGIYNIPGRLRYDGQ